MKKLIIACLFFGIMSLVGCSKYNDDDIAAMVRGEEITVGELRFLYADDKILENLDGTIKATLAMQEVKKLQLDISDELEEIQKNQKNISVLPPKDAKNESAQNIREFAEEQAGKLGMKPEEYHVKYIEKTQEISVYIIAYIEEMIGDTESVEIENMQEWTDKSNLLLEKLVENNKDEIEIYIK